MSLVKGMVRRRLFYDGNETLNIILRFISNNIIVETSTLYFYLSGRNYIMQCDCAIDQIGYSYIKSISFCVILYKSATKPNVM